MTVGKLIVFRLMTARAVERRHDGGDRFAIMQERVDVILFGLMAFDATDPLFRVRTEFPVIDDARRRLFVTTDASLGTEQKRWLYVRPFRALFAELLSIERLPAMPEK